MKSLFSYLAFLFLGLYSVKAQYTISGKIADNFESPIPFANIILMQKGDEYFVRGVVSNDEGKYLFEDIEKGTYQIEVSVLDFKLNQTEEFELIENKIADFVLEEEIENLDEVEVKNKRPTIRQTAEKLLLRPERARGATR